MTDELVRRLAEAKRRQEETGWSDPHAARIASREVVAAERALAAARGDQYAEVIDIGFQWDSGAPLPHLLANGSRAFVVCYATEPNPDWDGTYVRIVSPNDEEPEVFGVIEFWRCASVRLGAPNDEALHGHPLNDKGLEFYAPHEVHNSQWLEEHIRINSVHSNHSDRPWRELHHYFLAFHDEMFETLAAGVETRLIHGTLTPLLNELMKELVEWPHRKA
ncbi:hypothetical protein [Micromonospora sp. NPDC049301]|uniref:hypothetical protein n=1 Tax=Micromonospora sp. NPDC049301 TaxID=3155723 RepID=UPI003434B056